VTRPSTKNALFSIEVSQKTRLPRHIW
jgi:hypothetical protein